jgi:hypothetical protein
MVALILGLLQATEAAQSSPPATAPVIPSAVRGDRFQLVVPQGWKTLNDGEFVLLEHSSGASLLVQRVARAANFEEYARRQAERIMLPLGFASLGEPLHFKDLREEWIQYEILGNRIADRHRILYRMFKRDTGFFETVYEAKEDAFQVLLTEAQGIASSVQATLATPPPRRVRR